MVGQQLAGVVPDNRELIGEQAQAAPHQPQRQRRLALAAAPGQRQRRAAANHRASMDDIDALLQQPGQQRMHQPVEQVEQRDLVGWPAPRRAHARDQ